MESLYSCRRDCCPEMFFDKEKNIIVITDDFGGSVTLTPEQFNDLVQAYGKRFAQEANHV
ncbi:MAG: hypothetical protein IJD28_05380 [Deferribacterales bacterium]|nr:hypothetical protein [Deferribacterales bacterium]